MRTFTMLLLVSIPVATVGCHIGRTPQSTSPHGADVSLEVWVDSLTSGENARASDRVRRVKGELLAVADSGLLVQLRSTIALYQWGSFRRAYLSASLPSLSGNAPTANARKMVSDYARHPQGLDDLQLQALLRARGQEELSIVRP